MEAKELKQIVRYSTCNVEIKTTRLEKNNKEYFKSNILILHIPTNTNLEMSLKVEITEKSKLNIREAHNAAVESALIHVKAIYIYDLED